MATIEDFARILAEQGVKLLNGDGDKAVGTIADLQKQVTLHNQFLLAWSAIGPFPNGPQNVIYWHHKCIVLDSLNHYLMGLVLIGRRCEESEEDRKKGDAFWEKCIQPFWEK